MMKGFIKKALFIILLQCLLWGGLPAGPATTPDNSYKYIIQPDFFSGGSNLKVEMVFKGSPTGISRVILPSSWAGQEKLYDNLFQLRILSKDTVLEDTDKPHIKNLRHTPGAKITIAYKVRQSWDGEISGQRYQKYHPNITDEYFHFYGMTFFIYPAINSFSQCQFELIWKNFPKEWRICNSFGANQFQQTLRTSIQNLRRSVYIGGDYRIKKLTVRELPVYTALRGTEWNFSDLEFLDFIQNIIFVEREFWKDHDFQYFLITLTPFGKNNTNRGGSGLYQSFNVFYYSDSAFDSEFKALFAHELFHTWNNKKLGTLKKPEPLLYWFSEGFTDYYTRIMLFRAGMITFDDYIRDYNRKISEYWESPAREESNGKIQEGYWSDDFLGKLPYQRGDFIAHRWNVLIKEKSKNTLSLDDLMLTLFHSNKSSNRTLVITQELLVEKIKTLAGIDVTQDIKLYINEGKLFDFQEHELGPGLELYHTEEDIPQYRLKIKNSK